MSRCLVVLAVLVACGKSESEGQIKCARVLQRMEPLFARGSNAASHEQQLATCRLSLAKDPSRVAWLDCILAIDGEITKTKLDACEQLDREAVGSASP